MQQSYANMRACEDTKHLHVTYSLSCRVAILDTIISSSIISVLIIFAAFAETQLAAAGRLLEDLLYV